MPLPASRVENEKSPSRVDRTKVDPVGQFAYPSISTSSFGSESSLAMGVQPVDEPTLSKCQRLGTFVWNPKEKAFLGRTCSSWAQIFVFYCCLYASLAGFWALYLFLLYQGIDQQVPKWKMEQSALGGTPGLSLRPEAINMLSSKLTYDIDNSTVETFTASMNEFLAKYKTNTTSGVDCRNGVKPKPGQYCRFEFEIPSQCGPDFGFEKGEPCFILKMNRMYGWEPQLDSQASNSTEPLVQLECESSDFLQPPVYSPQPGIPAHYFPFTNQKGYLSPFVFVQMHLKRDVEARVVCKVMAHNIHHDTAQRLGAIEFQVWVDSDIAHTHNHAEL